MREKLILYSATLNSNPANVIKVQSVANSFNSKSSMGLDDFAPKMVKQIYIHESVQGPTYNDSI